MADGDWWLNLYVMLSRATRMQDLLLVRPPPRAVLENGPPAELRDALSAFHDRIADSERAAEVLCNDWGWRLSGPIEVHRS